MRSLRTTRRLLESMLEDEAVDITRKTIEMAKQGHASALKLCIDRIFPQPDRAKKIELPDIKTVADAAAASSQVLTRYASGDLSAAQAADTINLLSAHVRLLEITDLEARLAALEADRANDSSAA